METEARLHKRQRGLYSDTHEKIYCRLPTAAGKVLPGISTSVVSANHSVLPVRLLRDHQRDVFQADRPTRSCAFPPEQQETG